MSCSKYIHCSPASLSSPVRAGRSCSFSPAAYKLPFFSNFRQFQAKDKGVNSDVRPRCSAVSRPHIQEYAELFQNGLPSMVKWREVVENDIEEDDEAFEKVRVTNEIKARVHTIKSMLGSMEDGAISISAYDTAWVALVKEASGDAPQFPSALDWIAMNQLPDGSWGDPHLFFAHDRLINTLACVVALTSWNIHHHKCQQGLMFIRENISRLEKESDEHMPIGFEVAFPSLLEVARSLAIDVPYDSPVLQKIYAQRNLKLTRIPKEAMHKMPTTLLHSLEGMPGLDWEKLLKLQCPDGSFLFSPSSTAYALMQTRDPNCFNYLTNAVQRFNGGVPNVYPVDMFEHIWAVDRLQRLGISRYFEPEIRDCMEYVYRYWTEKGICWARNTLVHDIDDTAMGFRLLRLHGYDVSANVFENFEKGGEFFCFAGQSNQAVTGVYNLYRASQVQFPGEEILERAKHFSGKFLRGKDKSELLDKWIIAKDLPGEVAFALEVPWYASFPRLETRFYIEQYGGDDDVWIGKTLYRMPNVNNNTYLELAKMDYNNCQAVHHAEWERLQQWYTECRLENLGTSRRALLLAYFVAAASIYEPARWQERVAWAKTAALVDAITCYFGQLKNNEQRRAFVNEFRNCIDNNPLGYFTRRRGDSDKTGQEFTGKALLGTLNHIALDALVAQGRDIGHNLRTAWGKWLKKWQEEGDGLREVADLLVQTINLSTGHWLSQELMCHPEYLRLSHLTNKICHTLGQIRNHKVQVSSNDNGNDSVTSLPVEVDIQELVKLVLENSTSGIPSSVKQTFLMVAKSFYYSAYCDSETIDSHISKVLFQRVD